MSNVHTPERLVGETMTQYRARRAASKAIVFTATKGPHQAPAVNKLDTARFWLGQHTNRAGNLRRAAITAAGGIHQFKIQSRRDLAGAA